MQLWQEPMVKLRLPNIYNLRRDPFERADFNSNTYWDWMVDHVPHLYQARPSWRPRSRTCEVSATSKGSFLQPGYCDGLFAPDPGRRGGS